MHARRTAALAVALAFAAGCRRSDAQSIPRSQLATVEQQVAGARISITYRRPVARGRALFGSLVRWGEVWSPSSDSAARLTVTAPVTVNGQPLPAGAYGVWAVPDSAAWTVIFSGVPAAFHLRYPAGKDVLRVKAAPERGEHVESLLFAFPMVDADSALLQLRWGTTVVPLRIRAGAAAR